MSAALVPADLEAALLEYLLELLPPGRLPQPPEGDADPSAAYGTVAALAHLLASHGAQALAAVLEWFPSEAGEAALRLTGAARAIDRYPGEYVEAFRERVLSAQAFWQAAGTLPGMRLALEQLGYGGRTAALVDGDPVTMDAGVYAETSDTVLLVTVNAAAATSGTTSVSVDGVTYELDVASVPDGAAYFTRPPAQIVEHWRSDPSIWAEFSVYVSPARPEFTAPPWGGGTRWGLGAKWGLTLGDDEPARIRSVIRDVKPAHARLRKLYLVLGASPVLWGMGATWGDGSLWGGGDYIEI